MKITPEEWEVCLRVLQQVSENPAIINDDERAKALIAKIHSQGKKGQRRTAREQRVASDRSLRERTSLVQAQAAPRALPAVPNPDATRESTPGTLSRALLCYACKQPYTELHFFYHSLCPACARFSFAKRGQSADLRGRSALVTGGRVKIGFQVALRLLRDGARVLVTTRFPRDAMERFRAQPDFSDWADRLRVCGLDLRDIPVVEALCDSLLAQGEPLDIVINNAAQTIQRPADFYRHLLEAEREAEQKPQNQAALPAPVGSAQALAPQVLEAADRADFNWKEGPGVFLLENYLGRAGSLSEQNFPNGQLDSDGQQIDRRSTNSWRLRLEEVGTVEMLESLLVNTVAPFVLNSRLLPLLRLSPHARRFIVNVSAVEGQFERASKTGLHPHTNMAKAALNMMTRTGAQDLARDGIFMNSVDPGWMSDQNPHQVAAHLRQEHGFYPPLDAIDAAARVCDPIVQGVTLPIEPLYGHFLKDFRPQPW